MDSARNLLDDHDEKSFVNHNPHPQPITFLDIFYLVSGTTDESYMHITYNSVDLKSFYYVLNHFHYGQFCE